ncbi:MAG: DUF1150 family protein [Hyphomicrobiales bacterium]|nr:DUF1150 family protein [Hyphomicrobiales bacterium]
MKDRPGDPADQQTPLDPRNLSASSLEALGKGQVAYIKPVVVDGKEAFAIHGADGQPLAVVEDSAVALAVVRQNDLEPVRVH